MNRGLLFAGLGALSLMGASLTLNASPVSTPFSDTDIGNPGAAGSASVNTTTGIYTVQGGGADIYDPFDQFNYCSEQVSGSTTLIVHVDSQQNTNSWAKAGLMFRDSLSSTAAEVSVLENPGGKVEVQWRDADNGSCNSSSQIITGASTLWLKLVTSSVGVGGSISVSGYFAVTAGVPGVNDWILITTHTTATFSGSTYLAGLAVTAHDNSQLGTAVFSNFNYLGSATTPTLTAAVSAKSFLGSMGVCTHVEQGGDNPTQVPALLEYIGVSNVRDDGTTNAATLQSFINIHNASGVKYCLLPVDGDLTDSLAEYDELAKAGALMAVEGPNEMNNYSVTYNGATTALTETLTTSTATTTIPGTFLPGAQFQRDLYTAVKADSNLTGIPVFAPSEAGGSEPNNVGLQYITIPSGAGALMADGTVYGDYANTHNYLSHEGNLNAPIANTAWGAEDPTLAGAWDGMYGEYCLTWNQHFNGYPITQLPSIPRVTTETGWVTVADSQDVPVTEDQQGKLFLNLFLDAYRRGWSYSFIYMLRDDPTQGYWGLFHTDNTPKLSATYLHNLTTVLADSGTSTPGALSYAIPNEPITVHDMVIQKSNGAFELAVWDEEVSGTDSVTVNLGVNAPTVSIYDPTVGTTATQVLSNVTSIPLTLSDHPVILEIGAPPVVTVSSSTSALAVNGVATGTLTFTSNIAPTTSLPITYTVSGTGVPGTDYTALTGTVTIAAGTTSVSVPVTAATGATPNATVIASISTTSTYQAGTPASATVVLEPATYNAAAQTAYGTSSVAGTAGNSLTLTFQGLPGSPAGTVYVWYFNGTAIASTTTPSYTISNPRMSQSGTYSVYAYAPGGVTGSESFTVTITCSSSASSFTDADIGNPSPAGSASVASGVYTVSGGGADIYNTFDQFNFYSEPESGDGTLIVQVTSQTNTSAWAKAGLMFRNSSADGDAWVGVFQNPGGLVEMQWRDTANAEANWPDSQITTGAAVNWLELVKTGNSFSAYYATTTGVPTANDWTLIATHMTTFVNSTFLAGLAVTSHDNGVLGTATFSNFTYPGSSSVTLPIVTVSSSTAPLAVNGISTGTITFTSSSAPTTSLPITYTVSGTGVPGTDYTALTGTVTIAAGTTSASVPVTAKPGATPNATVIVSIASTSTYQAATASSATVVLEGCTYNASAQDAYGSSNVSGSTGGSVTLTFQGLPGNPSGTVYVWYFNGTAFTTTTSGSYTLSNAQASQAGTYSVYASAPGGVTGSESYNVTVTTLAATDTPTMPEWGVGLLALLLLMAAGRSGPGRAGNHLPC